MKRLDYLVLLLIPWTLVLFFVNASFPRWSPVWVTGMGVMFAIWCVLAVVIRREVRRDHAKRNRAKNESTPPSYTGSNTTSI